MDTYSDPMLAEKRTASENAMGAYNQSVTDSASLPDLLKTALNKKFSTDNPLIQQRESQTQNYLNTTTQAPLDYTARSAGGNSDIIYNPLQQANLIQQRTSSALAPLSTTNYLLGLESGGMGDIIDATTRAQAGETAKLKGAADLSRQSYQDYLNELSMKADEAYKNASLANSSSGLGLSDSLLAALMQSILGNDTQETTTGTSLTPLDDLIETDEQDIQALLGGGILNSGSATLAPPKKKTTEKVTLNPTNTTLPFSNLKLTL